MCHLWERQPRCWESRVPANLSGSRVPDNLRQPGIPEWGLVLQGCGERLVVRVDGEVSALQLVAKVPAGQFDRQQPLVVGRELYFWISELSAEKGQWLWLNPLLHDCPHCCVGGICGQADEGIRLGMYQHGCFCQTTLGSLEGLL